MIAPSNFNDRNPSGVEGWLLDELFEPQSGESFPQAPRPTKRAWATLRQILPPLDIDREFISAVAERQDARQLIVKRASAKFEGDRHRAAQRMIANAFTRESAPILADIDKLLGRVTYERDIQPSEDAVLAFREGQPALPTLVFNGSLSLLFGGVFVVGFRSEFTIATYMVKMAGIGFEEAPSLAFAYCFGICATGYLTLKHIEACLDAAGKNAFRKWLNYIGGFVSVTSLVLFNYTIGSLMHRDVAAFGEEETSSAPALWPLLMATSFALAFLLSMAAYLLRQQIDAFVEPRPVKRAVRESRSKEAGRLQQERQLASIVHERGHEANKVLDAQKAEYSDDHLAILVEIEESRRLRREQLNASFLSH